MDPLTGLTVGSIIGNAAGNLVTKAVEGVARGIKQEVWVEADELGRVFDLLEAAFGHELPSITRAEMDFTWRTDTHFTQEFARLSAGDQIGHAALVDSIEPLVGGAADEAARDVAGRLAEALVLLLPEAKNDSRRVLYEIRKFEHRAEAQMNSRHAETTEHLERIEGAVFSQSSPLLILSSDWPSAAEDALKRAAAEDEAGLRKLTQALAGKTNLQELPALINRDRPWMVDLSAAVWELLSVLAQEEGLWPEAQRAWITARDKPGADWPGCTVRAAEAAVQASDRATAVSLLDAAREENDEHPRVLFHDALLQEDPHHALAALGRITTSDRALAAAVQVAMVSVHVERDDFASARSALRVAMTVGAGETLSYRIAETTLSMREMMASDRPSGTAAAEFATAALHLEADLLKRNQVAQAVGVRAQAAAFYGSIGDVAQAQALLASAVETYDGEQLEVRAQLALAAANLHGYDTVGTLIRPADEGDLVRYLRAAARSRGDDDEKRAAARELDELVGHDDEDVRQLAAMRRLAISGEVDGVEWNDKAADAVASRHIGPAVVFKAFWLENSGRSAEAERELLAHSDQVWALAELLRLAARAEDWTKAARYADALLGQEPDWATHLSAAEALRAAGDDARARSEFEKLSEDQQAPPAIRAGAYSQLTRMAFSRKDFAQTVVLADGWLAVEPDHADAAWARVLALAILGRDPEALAAITERGLHPRQPDEYRIAAQLYVNAGNRDEALPTVVALADEHDPPSEEMEAFVFFAAMHASNIPDELRDRVSFDRFTTMFPESRRLQALSIGDLKQYLEQDLVERAKHVQGVEDRVFKDGQMPTAILALVTNNDTTGLWMRMSWARGLPMGYGSAELDELEREDARAAVGGAALWDGASVFVASHVLPELTDIIRTTFPNSHVSLAALADIAEGARSVSFESGEHKEVGYNLREGAPEFRDRDADLAEAYRKRAERALAFAHKLRPVPDADPDVPQPEDDQLDHVDDSCFRALLATYSVARRLRLPIYSDDRDVRRRARAKGLPAFGTIALLDVLAEARYISPEARRSARRVLLSVRARGVKLDLNELMALGAEAGWKLTPELRVALTDRGPWVEDTAATFLVWEKFLRRVHREAPGDLAGWVTRMLVAAHRARPELAPAFLAQQLVMLSLLPMEDGGAMFVRAVIAALRRTRQHFATGLGDPALAGFSALLEHFSRHPRQDLIGPPAWRIWTTLPFADQPRALPLLLGG
ncbi:MAG: hypothetical protein WKF96_02065 [Solirubrobacteraceae bacterium]